MSTDRWIEVNGVCLRYRLGEATGPTLVLVHEMGGCIESWDEVAELLQDSFRTLQYDQRGFGFSEKNTHLSLSAMVADLEALLDALGVVGPVNLAGAALGAFICMAFALEHPERVARMVVSSPATGATATARRQLTAWAEEVAVYGVRAITGPMFTIAYPAELRETPRRMQQHRLRWLGMTPESYVAICRMMMESDLMSRLPQLGPPTLVLGCTHDGIRPATSSAQVASRIPNSTFSEVPSGHYLPLQHPHLFAEQLRRFLGRSA